jgi:Fe-S-cluster containining protein
VPENPWYARGLRFECQRCGGCCTSRGDHAYVYLLPSEARAIAAFLRMSDAEFAAEHVLEEDGWLRLRTTEPRCPFLGEDRRCRIYPVRPVQCRTWPFWRENLVERVWREDLPTLCPGVGRGLLHDAAEIDAAVEASEQWDEP